MLTIFRRSGEHVVFRKGTEEILVTVVETLANSVLITHNAYGVVTPPFEAKVNTVVKLRDGAIELHIINSAKKNSAIGVNAPEYKVYRSRDAAQDGNTNSLSTRSKVYTDTRLRNIFRPPVQP